MAEYLEVQLATEVGKKIELEKNVAGYYQLEMNDLANRMLAGIELCESPIEQLMLIAFNAAKTDYGCNSFSKLEKENDIFVVEPQHVLELKNSKSKNGQKFRMDFAIWVHNQNGNNFNFAIECDGYEYHSNKEKFAADRVRDRELLSEGYVTIRLSGSEIKKDPALAAANVFHTILNYMENCTRL